MVPEQLVDKLCGVSAGFDDQFSAWIVTDPADLRLLSKSMSVSAARARSFETRLPRAVIGRVPNLQRTRESLLFFMDGPQHAALRVKTAALLRHRLKAIEIDLRTSWEEAWSSVAMRENFELVEDLIVPTVSKAFGLLLACPVEVSECLRGWSASFSASMSGLTGPQEYLDAEAAIQQLTVIIDGHLENTRAGSWVDLLFSDCGHEFTDEERRSTLILLLVAGFDTSISMLSNGIVYFLQRSGPQLNLSASTAEEIVQAVCPVNFTMREVVEAFDFQGARFQVGERILLSWAGGNQITASARPSRAKMGFAFGNGIHSCLGKHMALLQLNACFAGISPTRRVPVISGDLMYNSNACFFYAIEAPISWAEPPQTASGISLDQDEANLA